MSADMHTPQKFAAHLIYRDPVGKPREFYTAQGYPHLPDAWSADVTKARVYRGREVASSVREWVSANTSGATVHTMDTLLPELLAALQTLVDMSDSEGLICVPRLISEARAAIAKAAGSAS